MRNNTRNNFSHIFVEVRILSQKILYQMIKTLSCLCNISMINVYVKVFVGAMFDLINRCGNITNKTGLKRKHL